MKSIFRSTPRSRRNRQAPAPDTEEKTSAFFPESAHPQAHSSPFFQAKLTVGQPDDPYEREADAVADQVVSGSNKATPAVQPKPISTIQRLATPNEEKMPGTNDARMKEDRDIQEKPEPERKEEEMPVQKMEAPKEEDKTIQKAAELEEEPDTAVQQKSESGQSAGKSPLSSRLSQSRGRGEPLPAPVRTQMEQGIGADFSDVRIHRDSESVDMNKDLRAQAFTHGQDVYFNAGKFDPQGLEGQRLLAHELTHVVQQNSTETIKRKESAPVSPQQSDDEKTLLGQQIIDQFPNGLNIAVYDTDETEFENKASEWAVSQNAVGVDSKKLDNLSAKNIKFGLAMSDKNLFNKISKLIEFIKSAVETASTAHNMPYVEDISKINSIAFFSHGSSNWTNVDPLDPYSGKPADFIKNIAPYLKPNVNIMFYACNVARALNEEHSWTKGTFESGGKGSYNSKIASYLNDQGIDDARVWGHTTTGHVTDNFALRYFSSNSKGQNAGLSYVDEYVFTPYDYYLWREDIKTALLAEGYDITKLTDASIEKFLTPLFYSCYAEANKKLKYNNLNLAMAAPMYPAEVATLINNYWEQTFWPLKKDTLRKMLIKKTKIKKVE